MSQPRTRSNTKDAMTQQMAIMQFIMPFVTLFFAWTFQAGLALYWTTTSVFSMVQQYFVTGWGSLAVMPEFLQNIFPQRENKNNGGSKSSGEKRKDTQPTQKTVESTAEVVGGNGHGESSSKSNSSANGSSSARRRSRSNSASARRRGNTPKRNVSRS